MNRYEVLVTETFSDKLQSLATMPFRNRPSIYFENDRFRDMVFKGFTIVYEIEDKKVIIFSIVKNQLEP